MGGAYSTNGSDEKLIQNFGRNTGGKRPLEKPRRRWGSC